MRQEIRWLLEEKYDGPLGSEARKRTKEAEKDIAKLKKGEHIDYVIGWVDFLGCKIDLSKKPFIPRPETEFWVEKAIEEMQSVASRTIKFSSRFTPKGPYASRKISSFSRRPKVLDVFAGSGCIGIAILRHIPGARVDFAEKEKKFLKQIEISAKLNGVERERYRLIQSDIFSNIKKETRPELVEGYDYIFANPPYVAEARKQNVQKSVLEQEPSGAVFGGEDGLRYIRPFLQRAKDYLKESGAICMEFDSSQKREIEKLLKQYGYENFKILKDQYGKWRYAVAQKSQ